MKRAILTILLCLLSAMQSQAAPPKGWTEFRRALLINSSGDKAHAQAVKGLEKALEELIMIRLSKHILLVGELMQRNWH